MMREWGDHDPGDPGEERRLRRWLAVFIALQLLGILSIAWPALARPPVVPAGRSFTCTAVAVWDGDGPIWCAEGPRIRLAGIAARELDGSCRPYHPCPAASGIAARDALVALLGGARGATRTGHVRIAPVALACRSHGLGKGDRTAAECRVQGCDLGTLLVARRVALPWDRADRAR